MGRSGSLVVVADESFSHRRGYYNKFSVRIIDAAQHEEIISYRKLRKEVGELLETRAEAGELVGDRNLLLFKPIQDQPEFGI